MSQNYAIDYVCHSVHRGGETVGEHSHTCYELVYYVTGSGATVIDGKEYEIAPNTFVLIPPDTKHSERHDTENKMIFIGFHGMALSQIPSGHFNDSDQKIILNTITDMLNEVSNHLADYRKVLLLKLQEMIVYVTRICSPSGSRKNDTIDFAIKYIEESYMSPINWRTLAASCNYSYDYFHHLFKKVTGIAPTQYLIACRLNAAKEMLISAENSYNCTEIAYKCGFSSSSQFSSQFKHFFGVSPKRFYLDHKSKNT